MKLYLEDKLYQDYKIVSILNLQNNNEYSKFIIKYHYKKTIPRGCNHNYALFINNILMGIANYGQPNSKMYNNINTIELKRFTLHPDCLKNTASWFMAKCHKELKKENNINDIISYAEAKRHIGTIYKASNFTFVKKTKPGQSIKFKGKKLHLRQCYQKLNNGEYTSKAKTVQDALKTGQAKYVSTGYKNMYLYKLKGK